MLGIASLLSFVSTSNIKVMFFFRSSIFLAISECSSTSLLCNQHCIDSSCWHKFFFLALLSWTVRQYVLQCLTQKELYFISCAFTLFCWLVGSPLSVSASQSWIPSALCASCASHLHELTLILGATHSFWLQLTNLICSCSFQPFLCSPCQGCFKIQLSIWDQISFSNHLTFKTQKSKLLSKSW